MDAREFFQNVARRNYFEFFEPGDDIRLLWNAVVSMNSVAEYLALDQLNYAQISRNQLERTANQIRKHHHLLDLKFCAETFKHIRKIKDQRGGASFTLTGTSTNITSDRATWMINQFDVVEVLQKAFAKLDQLSQLR
jgi:hypothetical protein